MTTPNDWIGARPAPLQLGAILVVGVCGILIAGLQPLVLGLLAEEGRITAAQLGHAATAELLVMGAASAYAGARWPAERLRSIGVISALLLALLDVATLWASGAAITLLRACAGAPSGVLIWITIAMIARSPTPERWSGIYLTVQTLAQFVTAAALTAWVVDDYGANGTFIALASLCCVVAAAALLVPRRLAPLTATLTGSALPDRHGWVALAAAFLWMACLVAVWVYIEPLSRQAGHPPRIAGYAVAISLAGQVLGGATATLLAGRLRWFPTVLTSAVLAAGCFYAFAMLPGEVWFLATAALFGFLWLFTLPFLVPMVIAADPTRRAAVLIGGAELLGGSLGPLLVSFVVTDTDARGAMLCGGFALVAALGIASTLHLRARGSQATLAER